MTDHVLLVEPDYYSQFPPLGLLKLSTYHKSLGHTTELVKGCQIPNQKPNKIYITSLFTWTWKPVWKAVKYYKMMFPRAEICLGGIYASVLPEHARLSGADQVFEGIFPEAEDLIPDYNLRPDWDSSIIFASRGCNRNCGFCAVPRIEGKLNSIKPSIKKYIWPSHKRIIFFDNNFLWNPYKNEIFEELISIGRPVDFNQGLDARLINNDIAEKLSTIPYDKKSGIRIAYDSKEQKNAVKNAISKLNDNGIKKRKIFVYTLFNYNDTPDDFLERLLNILNWGAVCYPMRYEPLNALEKNQYISPNWTKYQIEAVQKARRVIGFGGTFPPYQALINKLENAGDFDEAFELREPREA